ALAEHRLVCDRDPPVQLDAPADEQGVVRDLLHDRVLEAVPPLAPLTGRGLEDEIRSDELIDRVRDPRSSGLAEDAVAEALSDHGGELDRLFRAWRQPVDPCGDDAMQRRRHLERGRSLAELPFALLILRDGP